MRILANKNPKQNWEKDAKKGLRREKSQMWTERPLIQCSHKISITDTPREGMLQLGSLIWKGLLYFNQDEKLDQKAKNVVWNQQLCWVRGLGKSIQPLQAKWWKWLHCQFNPHFSLMPYQKLTQIHQYFVLLIFLLLFCTEREQPQSASGDHMPVILLIIHAMPENGEGES